MTKRFLTVAASVLIAGGLAFPAAALATAGGPGGHHPPRPCGCGHPSPSASPLPSLSPLPSPSISVSPEPSSSPLPSASASPLPPSPATPPRPPHQPPHQPPPNQPPAFVPGEPLLPVTGTQNGVMAAVGLLMVAAGAFALWRGRRRVEN